MEDYGSDFVLKIHTMNIYLYIYLSVCLSIHPSIPSILSILTPTECLDIFAILAVATGPFACEDGLKIHANAEAAVSSKRRVW